jgi:kumamolisin
VPQTTAGFTHALDQAFSDGVAVISDGWGRPESDYKDEELNAENDALKVAAERGITVLAAVGDRSDIVGGKRAPHEPEFPASSPWVLAVGGTTLKAVNGNILSEIPWVDANGTMGSQGGTSKRFRRPSWQSAIPMDKGRDSGREIPDVVASADPSLGIGIIVHGKIEFIGGTSASVPVWAGLITLINQGVGHSVGYINPRLYQELGPAKVLRPVQSGDKAENVTRGQTAGNGWTPIVGWGSPNGTQLLEWIRTHPVPNAPAVASYSSCMPAPSAK